MAAPAGGLPTASRDEGHTLTASHSSDAHEVGLLDAVGLDCTLDAELARAARHELPLVLVMLEVSGAALNGDHGLGDRVSQAIAAALTERIRAEDRAARLGPLKFAVLAVETDESVVLASSLADHVRKRLARLGSVSDRLHVATGAVDCQYDELSRRELLEEAERRLASAPHTDFLRRSA